MIKEKRVPILAVRAIILNEDYRILLLKRTSEDAFGDFWCLPGGKIEFGQTAEKTIAREVREETSLICTAIEFLFYQDNLPENSDEKHYLTLYFKCNVEGEIKLNNESSELAWVYKEELNKYNIAFKNDVAIRKYWKDYDEIL